MNGKLAVSIPEAAEMIGLGRSSIYNLFRDGKLQAFKAGKRTLVKVEDIQRFVDDLPRHREVA